MTILTLTYPLLLSVTFTALWPYLLLFVTLMLLVAVLIQNHLVRKRVRQSIFKATSTYEMMEKALKIADNDVIIYDIPAGIVKRVRGSMFPCAEMKTTDFVKRLHPDDAEQTLATIRQLVDGKFQTIEYCCRWNANDGDGEPQWRYIRNSSVVEHRSGSSKPVSIISVLVDETELRRQQQEEEELTKRYKQIFEDSIVGLSFYSPDGWLLTANKMMREICHFDSVSSDSYFSNVNLFDIAPFNEVLDRYNPKEYLACSLSIVPEREMYIYLEIGVHPIYDEEGKLIP